MPNKPKRQSFAHKAGDNVEKLGEKVSRAGAKKLGDAITRVGDQIEHSQDDKNLQNKKPDVY